MEIHKFVEDCEPGCEVLAKRELEADDIEIQEDGSIILWFDDYHVHLTAADFIRIAGVEAIERTERIYRKEA